MKSTHLTTRTYVIVWLALLGLTLTSFLLSLAHLGAFDVVASLVIAAAKTLLVLLFFMHLIEERAPSTLVMVVVAAFTLLLMLLMVGDVTRRQTFPRAPVPVAPPAFP